MSLSKSPNDPITDDECVYRRVNRNLGMVEYDDGFFRVSASAFNDPKRQPSVDRASLQGCDPEKSKIKLTDGIISLIAGDIRAAKVINDQAAFVLDIKPDPSKHNKSHAIIIFSPEYRNRLGTRQFLGRSP